MEPTYKELREQERERRASIGRAWKLASKLFWIGLLATVGLGFLLSMISCSGAPVKGFEVRTSSPSSVEMTLYYTSPDGVIAFIEFQGFTVMTDMSESLRLQIQAICDQSAREPPPMGAAVALGLYKSPRQKVFAPLCLYDGVRPQEVLELMAEGLFPQGYWHVIAHDKAARKVIFRFGSPKEGKDA